MIIIPILHKKNKFSTIKLKSIDKDQKMGRKSVAYVDGKPCYLDGMGIAHPKKK